MSSKIFYSAFATLLSITAQAVAAPNCPPEISAYQTKHPVFFKVVSQNGSGTAHWGVFGKLKADSPRHDQLLFDRNGNGKIEKQEIISGSSLFSSISIQNQKLPIQLNLLHGQLIVHIGSFMSSVPITPPPAKEATTFNKPLLFAMPDLEQGDYTLVCGSIQKKKQENLIEPQVFIISNAPKGMQPFSILYDAIPKENNIKLQVEYHFDGKVVIEKKFLKDRC